MLRPLRATEIAAQVVTALFDRYGIAAASVDRVLAGMVLQDMTESNPARIVAMRTGIPDRAPAFTVNMQCCSGMMTVITAAQQVALGDADVVLCLGLESMSNAPHMVPGSRWGHRLGHGEFIDTLKECTLAGSKMWGDPRYMVDVAENHAKVDGVSRQEMDEYAVISHRRALDAMAGGRFARETVAMELPARGGKVDRAERDEHPRPEIDLAELAALQPVIRGGTITAGNAAGINDGAAAALVCSEAGLARLGIDPLARILLPGTSIVGCDPHLMGYSCVDAYRATLKATELTLDDLDLIECNEGFAVQLVACARQAGWPSERLNVDGGSIGLGHPVGMSGLRIVVHLAHALHERGLNRGLATVPAGSGLGTALVLEHA
jgi:acetyl-CoA C-acetyltransferase